MFILLTKENIILLVKIKGELQIFTLLCLKKATRNIFQFE